MRFIITIGVLLFLIPTGYGVKSIWEESALKAVNNTATISGNVVLPPVNHTARRTFRGSAYRSRGAEAVADNSHSATVNYTNTIISAHPTSYEVEELPTSDSILIVQENAEFIPNVTPVTVGSIVHFVNNDSFYHNVFSLTPGAKFNIGRRPTGDIYAKEIPPAKWKVSGLGPIDIFCDIHSQMNAVILSLNTPYFTRVRDDGTYTLEGLPEGTYELRAYSKNLEIQSQKITVAANEHYEVPFNFME